METVICSSFGSSEVLFRRKPKLVSQNHIEGAATRRHKTYDKVDRTSRSAANRQNGISSSNGLLLKQFAQIGIGPGLDVDVLDEATKRGLARAANDGRNLLEAALRQGARQKNVNGWNYPPPDTGRAGDKDDFILRSALQSLWGIVANDPAEAIYLNTSTGPDGQQLTGANRYSMHFP
jgi:hypothetical protein